MGRLIKHMRDVAAWKAAEESRMETVRITSYDSKENTYTVQYRGLTMRHVPNLAGTVLEPGRTATLLMRGVTPVGIYG